MNPKHRKVQRQREVEGRVEQVTPQSREHEIGNRCQREEAQKPAAVAFEDLDVVLVHGHIPREQHDRKQEEQHVPWEHDEEVVEASNRNTLRLGKGPPVEGQRPKHCSGPKHMDRVRMGLIAAIDQSPDPE